MNRPISPGTYTLFLTAVVGAWMIVAPFIMKAQPVGAAWSRATINDVAVGGILVFVSLCGLCAYLALVLRDVVRAAGQKSQQTTAEPAA